MHLYRILSLTFICALMIMQNFNANEKKIKRRKLYATEVVALGSQRQILYGLSISVNDYISFATYAWENPQSATAAYISKDGQKNNNLIALGDYPKLCTMFKLVNDLSVAYCQSADPLFLQRAAEWVRAWFINPQTRMLPHLRYAQIVPYKGIEGNGTGIIDFWQLPKFLRNVDLLRQQKILTHAENEIFTQWLRDYLVFLQTSKQGNNSKKRKNNHAVYYYAQRVAIKIYLGETQSAHTDLNEIFSRFDNFFAADGSQPHELKRATPLNYSIFALKAWIELVKLGKEIGCDYTSYQTANGISLKHAYQFLSACSAENPGPFSKDDNFAKIKELDEYF